MTQRAQEILARLPDGPVIGAEIGVFKGQTAQTLLGRSDLTLYLIDNWMPFSVLEGIGFNQKQQDKNYGEMLDRTDFAGDRRKIVISDSVRAAELVPGRLDFVFIDANHYYPHVKNDIEAWLHKVKPGGLICGHDYANPDYSFGADVKRASDEVAELLGYTIETGRDYTWFMRV